MKRTMNIFLSKSRNEGWAIGVTCTLISATLIFFLPLCPMLAGMLPLQRIDVGKVTALCALGFVILFRFASLKSKSASLKSKSVQVESSFRRHRRQLTPIGKFSLLSQTERNPSIISFFIALASKDDKGMGIVEFRQLWNEVLSKHERLRFCVSDGDNCFEDRTKSIDDCVLVLPHPRNPDEFKARLNWFLTSPINVEERPLEISFSSGPIGASGAILDHDELIQQGYTTETVALFRIHHVICDGVSLSAIIKDSADEKDRLDSLMSEAIQEHRARARNISTLKRIAWHVMYYVFGSVVALSRQIWMMLTMTNPFDKFTNDKDLRESTRSVSWKVLSTVEDAKSVTKAISSQTCLNDLFVSLLGSALERQYQELNAKSTISCKGPSSVGIVIPVHLTGSILPGQSIGNDIGAFVSAIPFNSSNRTSSLQRLREISRVLRSAKQTPAPQISWFITALISKLGYKCVAKQAIVRCNCHASAVISYVHGFPFQLHWKGTPIKSLAPFLPLPPRVKIGVGVFSYDGKIVISVTSSDVRVVPDTCRFLDFMLEEYEAIKKEVSNIEGNK